MYISHIKEDYEGDIYFPDYNKEDWLIEHEEDKGPFIFRIYKKI